MVIGVCVGCGGGACCWLFLFVSLGKQPPEKSFGVALGSVALILNVKLHEGGAGPVLFTAVPTVPRAELRK